MNGLTFFAKKRFFHKSDNHLMRGSSMIRADQIADYLGARVNPTEGYEDDVCIFVKPNTNSIYAGDIKFKDNSYVDIVDGENLVQFLKKNENLTVIVCSQNDFEYVTSVLKNKVVLIPQHHCNFDRIRRDRKEIKTVGIVGSRQTVEMMPEDLKRKLRDIGLDFVSYYEFKTRRDIINFYKGLDIQIIWRPRRVSLSNPLKILNAASFGIPTVLLREKSVKEMGDCCLPVDTIDELVEKVKLLVSSPELYAEYSKKCIEKSEEYHISKIAEMYKKL